MRSLVLALLLSISCSLFAQDEYYKKDFFEYADKVYLEEIKTVQLYPNGFELGFPILTLGTNEKLKLSFDDLTAELKNLSYTIIHCNSHWEPSDISQSEYIDGYSEDVISDYSYSFNTLVRYVHYNLVFPTDVMKIKRSGNYVLKVFRDNDLEKVVLSRRFLVVENQVVIKAQVKQGTLARYRASRQEVDCSIDASNVKVSDPFSDIRVVITQNSRWDNSVSGLKPLYINGNEFIYDYDEENTFHGGNEYRFFDIKSMRFQTERVNDIVVTKDSNVVVLTNEERRSSKRYFTTPDINGQYVIRVQEGKDPDRDADYVHVKFSLPMEPLPGGDVYVFGKLSDWRVRPEFRLKYDDRRQAYTGTILLKQGYYNYQLAFVADGTTVADETVIEGNHSETENDYFVLVYLRTMGTSFEQLLGFRRINTANRDY